MSLSSVSLPPTNLPGAVEGTAAPMQRRDTSTHAIGLQHPAPLPLHHTGPHQPQHWAQHLNALHPPLAGRPYALPLPFIRPEPVTLANLTSLLSSASPARPSPFLLSLRVGDEVDALDEIGYRQWRHAFILELGHIPGQTVHDSGRIGEYKIRWAGWDAKWDEFVHGGRLAPLNSKVIGDTGPEAISEKESAYRIGKEWRSARQQGVLTDVAITFQPDPSAPFSSSHHRSLSSDDLAAAPLMLAHLALLSVRCPSLLSMFTDASSEDEERISYQLHPQSDSHIAGGSAGASSTAGPTSLDPHEGDAQGIALPPPTSARLHSDLQEGGWRRGRLSTPAGMRAGLIQVLPVESPQSARPASSGGRPATADASTMRGGMRSMHLGAGGAHHHPSVSSGAVQPASLSSSAPRRALNFGQTPTVAAAAQGIRRTATAAASGSALPSSTYRVPVSRGRSHLTPTVPSLSASAPSSPQTLKDVKPIALPPKLLSSSRPKADRWTASTGDEDVEREVESTVDAMTTAVELVDSIDGQKLDYADSDDDSALQDSKEEKKEGKDEGFVPLSDDDEASNPNSDAVSSASASAPGPLIPVFCVPGIRSYAALRAFVEFVYSDSFDASVQANGGAKPKSRKRESDSTTAPVNAGADDRARVGRPAPRIRQMREVGVGAGEGEDSDEERLGLMEPDLDAIDDELLHQAIAARYGQRLSMAASRLAQEIDAGLRRDADARGEDGLDEDDDDSATPNPAHVLSMADLFDLACIGSRFHFPRLIALCASQLSDTLSVENIMEALQLCVRVGCLGGEEEDILASIFSSTSSSLLPPSSIAPPSSSSLPSHRVHDLSILLRIAFDFLSHHWDVVMKRDTSVKILHTLPFPAFSAVVQVKGRSVNSTHGSGRYTPPVVHHPASRLVRDIKQLYLQRGPPPTPSSSSSSTPALGLGGSGALLVSNASSFRFPACDFRLLVGDSVHWAHRSVLACRSQYFRALFSSRMQESHVSSITFPLSQHSPDSIATLLRYLYYDDVTNISYEAALYLLHHCTDFFGLASNQLEAACEQLIMQECEGAAAGTAGSSASGAGGADGEREAERRVGLSDVVRMSWRMSKWPLFERAVKFLDWAHLLQVMNQAFLASASPSPAASSPHSLSSASSAAHLPLYSSRTASAVFTGPTSSAASDSALQFPGASSEEKSNSSDAVQPLLSSSASSSSTAAPSPPHFAAFDMDLVRAIVAEKATPGITMRERGGLSRDEGATVGSHGEDSREDSRRGSLRIDGVGLMRRARPGEEDDEEEEEEEDEEDEVDEDLAGVDLGDADMDDDDGDAMLDDHH